MRKSIWLLAAYAAVALAGPVAAQQVPSTEPDYPRGKISGYLFGDAYYNVVGEPGHHYNAAGSDSDLTNIDGTTYPPRVIGRDLNGFQIRRIYFQADNDLSAKYSTRLRLEIDSKSLTSDGRIGVNLKTAYLQAKNVVPGGNFLFGMLTTPNFENVEEFWQYRSLEKTIADFRGLGSSSDLGVQLKGFVDEGHRLGYSAMIGDGTGQKPEDNRYKKAYLAIPLRPIEDLRLEPYVDYEDQPGAAERTLYKLFAGYDFKRVAIGGEVLDRIQHSSTGATTEPFGFSVFARTKQMHQLSLVGRFDRWQPNTRAANRIDTDLYIAGLDWEPYKDVHLIPNIEATQYHDRGTAVAPAHHDLQARLTFFYRWSKP